MKLPPRPRIAILGVKPLPLTAKPEFPKTSDESWIEYVLLKGGSLAITGQPNAGKTNFAAHVIARLVKGGLWLGFEIHGGARVLALSTEESHARIHRRIEKICKAADLPERLRKRIATVSLLGRTELRQHDGKLQLANDLIARCKIRGVDVTLPRSA